MRDGQASRPSSALSGGGANHRPSFFNASMSKAYNVATMDRRLERRGRWREVRSTTLMDALQVDLAQTVIERKRERRVSVIKL